MHRSDNRHRKSEKEEDEELLGEADEEEDSFVYEESPACKWCGPFGGPDSDPVPTLQSSRAARCATTRCRG